MPRALVIKTYGDTEIGEAIRDGMMKEIVIDKITDEELALVMEEIKQLRAERGVRQNGDNLRWIEEKAELEADYGLEKHGRVYNAILVAWATMWNYIFEFYEKMKAINRAP